VTTPVIAAADNELEWRAIATPLELWLTSLRLPVSIAILRFSTGTPVVASQASRNP